MDLTRLAQVSSSLGLALQQGSELADLTVELAGSYPDGFERLGLEEGHHETLEAARLGQPFDDDALIPAMEALSAKVRRPSTPPPAHMPAARLNAPRAVKSGNIIKPPMGGAVVRTSEGLILFGAPMWFNKWNLQRYWRAGGPSMDPARIRHEIVTYAVHDSDHAGPDVGLLPHEFNSYQAFIQGVPPFTIVTESPEQGRRLEAYFEDAYRGRLADLSERVRAEYPDDAIGVPNLMAEITRGFSSPEPETLRRIQSFDGLGLTRIGSVRIRRLGDQQYEIFDRGNFLGRLDLAKYPAQNVPRVPSPASTRQLDEVRRRAMEEGRAGLWPIGTSDGFDPHGTTSGFMIWNQGRFLLVDPPSRTLDYLKECGIPLDRLEGVIVTHGHSDHYADAIPKLLRERPGLKLHTTPTVFELLRDQYRLALGRDDLASVNFVPVYPQTRTRLNGLTFSFDYTFHTVPTVGFDIWDNDEELKLLMHFSGDTFADGEAIWKALEQTPDDEELFMSLERLILRVMRHGLFLYWGNLQDVPPVILMEGGMPPIHTAPSVTRALLQEARSAGVDVSRFLVYHISAKKARREKVPKWREGAEGWLELDTPPPVD